MLKAKQSSPHSVVPVVSYIGKQVWAE